MGQLKPISADLAPEGIPWVGPQSIAELTWNQETVYHWVLYIQTHTHIQETREPGEPTWTQVDKVKIWTKSLGLNMAWYITDTGNISQWKMYFRNG